MANKEDYLTALAGLSYIDEVGTPVEVVAESIPEIKLTVYDVYVLETNEEQSTSVKHRFNVYDEDGGSEDVRTVYVPAFKENLPGYNALITKIESIASIKSYWVRTISTDQQYVIVRACIYVTDHIEIKWYLVYVDGGLQYSEISNPEIF